MLCPSALKEALKNILDDDSQTSVVPNSSSVLTLALLDDDGAILASSVNEAAFVDFVDRLPISHASSRKCMPCPSNTSLVHDKEKEMSWCAAMLASVWTEFCAADNCLDWGEPNGGASTSGSSYPERDPAKHGVKCLTFHTENTTIVCKEFFGRHRETAEPQTMDRKMSDNLDFRVLICCIGIRDCNLRLLQEKVEIAKMNLKSLQPVLCT